MTESEFISQVFSDINGEYDLLVVSNGDMMVPVRLMYDGAAIQSHNITANERTNTETDLEEVVEYIDGRWASTVFVV